MDAEQQARIDALGRDSTQVQWGLLGQWWCIPADATRDEQAEMVHKIKDGMGADFAACPDEWVADRLYGGFKCPDCGRRHVYYSVGQYSFLAAQEGRYWANDAESRAEQWATLLERNGDQNPTLDGPFTEDAPRKEAQ